MRGLQLVGRHLGNLVGYLALVVAMSGTAYAAATIGSSDVVDNSLRSVDVRDDTSAGGGLTGSDLRAESVGSSEVKNGSLTKTDLAPSAFGARAYADVNVNTCSETPPSPCTATRSKGVTQVTRIGPFLGTYCITAPGLDSRETAAAVSIDWSGTGAPEGNATAMYWSLASPAAEGCANDTDFVVATAAQPPVYVQDEAGTGTTSVAGNAVASNTVSFTIVIP